MTTKGKPRGRNGGRNPSPLGTATRIYVPSTLATIIRTQGTAWVLETCKAELEASERIGADAREK